MLLWGTHRRNPVSIYVKNCWWALQRLREINCSTGTETCGSGRAGDITLSISSVPVLHLGNHRRIWAGRDLWRTSRPSTPQWGTSLSRSSCSPGDDWLSGQLLSHLSPTSVPKSFTLRPSPSLIVPTQVQDLPFGLVEPQEVHMSPHFSSLPRSLRWVNPTTQLGGILLRVLWIPPSMLLMKIFNINVN